MVTKSFRLSALLPVMALGFAATVSAEPRAGIDRPIRVGLFKGTGTNRYWHTNIHTAHMEIIQMLANPAGSNLGPELAMPPKGFSFYATPLPQAAAGGECAGNGCGPTPAAVDTFAAALDTLDVIILNSMVDFGSRVTQAGHRDVFRNFWKHKGYIALHWTLDTYGTWTALDSVHGARLQNRSNDVLGTLRRDSVFEHEPAWQYLNRGLFSNGLDTALYEEWMSLTPGSATIRATPYLKPTTKLDEGSLTYPSGMTLMGDHPVSWYRHFPTGGRFFFTSLGHRSQLWLGARTFRRQLYNAILWTAKFDSVSQLVSVQPAQAGEASAFARLSFVGPALRVSVTEPGDHVVEVRRLDGTLAGARRGRGGEAHVFTDLRPGVHAVSVRTGRGRLLRRVSVP